MLNRMYVGAAILAVIGLAWARYNYVVNDRDSLKTQNTQLVSDNQNLSAINTKERQDRIAAESARDNYLKSLEKTSNEIEALMSSVNSGATVLRVAAKCPSMPRTAANTVGAVTAPPELTENARRAYYTHRADEEKLGGLLEMCVNQLKIDRQKKELRN